MLNILRLSFLALCLLAFCSFTPYNELKNVEQTIQPVYTEKQFFLDSYNFRIANGISVPEEYYDILGIDNPNIPAWAKIPAAEPQHEEKIRDQIPFWIRAGQLMKESSSYYKEDGTIKYINQKRGGNNHRNGAIGAFQVLRCAWDDMRKKYADELRGYHYEDMQKNTDLNEKVACMYLLYIYNGRGNKNWNTTIMLYNAGPWGQIDHDSREYLRLVTKYGSKYK